MKKLLLSMILATIITPLCACDDGSDFPSFQKSRPIPIDNESRHRNSPHTSPAFKPMMASTSSPNLSPITSPGTSPKTSPVITKEDHPKRAAYVSGIAPHHDDGDTKRAAATATENNAPSATQNSADKFVCSIEKQFRTMFDTIFTKMFTPPTDDSETPAIIEDDTTKLETPALQRLLQPHLQSATQQNTHAWSNHLNSFEKDDVITLITSLNLAFPELATSRHAKPFLRKAESLAQQITGNSEVSDSGEFFGNYMVSFTQFIDLVRSEEMRTLGNHIETSESPKIQLLVHSIKALADARKNTPSALRAALEESQHIATESQKTASQLQAKVSKLEEINGKIAQQQSEMMAMITMLHQRQNQGSSMPAGAGSVTPTQAQVTYPQSTILRTSTANEVTTVTERIQTAAPTADGPNVNSSLRITASLHDRKSNA